MQPTLPESLLSALSALLAARIGLHFPKERWGDLERGIAAAATAFDLPDAASCAQRLLSAPLTHREIEILASHLTVGETYFFREPDSLDAFEQHILPALLQARAHNMRRLRIWCAGCCTGEEPYSIAMLLDRLIPEHEAWHVTLLATDINPVFLRKAAEGEYGDWSFRATPDWIRARYFKRKRDGRYALHPRIRNKVTFSYLNLAEDVYPALSNNTHAMDVIFCRNVLMYFTAERARAVVENFNRALVDGGWLVVSPAEASGILFSRFANAAFAGAALYRKSADADAPRLVSLVPAPAPEPEPWRPLPQALPEAAAVPATASLAAAPRGPGTPAQAARDCASQGRLDEAAARCREAIAADKLNPAGHYLLAAIQQEQGYNDDAMQSLKRALYLDPDFVLAHFALGNLYRSQGRHREARRHFEHAQALLRNHPTDEVLPESEGLTAGRLGEIIASVQSSLPQNAAGR